MPGARRLGRPVVRGRRPGRVFCGPAGRVRGRPVLERGPSELPGRRGCGVVRQDRAECVYRGIRAAGRAQNVP